MPQVGKGADSEVRTVDSSGGGILPSIAEVVVLRGPLRVRVASAQHPHRTIRGVRVSGYISPSISISVHHRLPQAVVSIPTTSAGNADLGLNQENTQVMSS